MIIAFFMIIIISTLAFFQKLIGNFNHNSHCCPRNLQIDMPLFLVRSCAGLLDCLFPHPLETAQFSIHYFKSNVHARFHSWTGCGWRLGYVLHGICWLHLDDRFPVCDCTTSNGCKLGWDCMMGRDCMMGWDCMASWDLRYVSCYDCLADWGCMVLWGTLVS